MYQIGGVQVVLNELFKGGYIHGDCLTVTGKTIEQNLKGVKFHKDKDVVRPITNPITPTGGVVGLEGNLAPRGAIVKVAGMHRLKHVGPARGFEREEIGQALWWERMVQ